MKQTEALAQFDDAVYKYAHQWMRYSNVYEVYELEDLAQIGRMYILKALEDYDPEAGMKLSSYIIQRIRWGFNTSLRSIMPKAKREVRHYSIDALNEEHSDHWHPTCTDEFHYHFEEAIADLSPFEKRVFTLRFVEEYTLKEIAKMENCSAQWIHLTIKNTTIKLEAKNNGSLD